MRLELSNPSTPDLKLSKLLDIGLKACYAALGLDFRTDINHGPNIFVEPAVQELYITIKPARPAGPRAQEINALFSEPGYLATETQVLFDEHAHLWGRGNRRCTTSDLYSDDPLHKVR
jgi:hypothetical protein